MKNTTVKLKKLTAVMAENAEWLKGSQEVRVSREVKEVREVRKQKEGREVKEVDEK
jgi:hypothetical protein